MIDTPVQSVANLKILQLNVNKSYNAQLELITSIAHDYDILLLQEPWLNSLELTSASAHWTVYYPTTRLTANHEQIRSIILVSTRLKSDSIQQLQVDSSDITIIKLEANTRSTIIYNIYNDCTHNRVLDVLTLSMETIIPLHIHSDDDHFFLFGDFNRHHPLWETPENEHLNSRAADINPLLDLIMNYGLEMMLPHGIPTLESHNTKRWTRPDNAWRSPNDFDPLIACKVEPAIRPPRTDHLPIATTLQFPTARTPDKAYRSYRSVEWDKYRDVLRTHIPPIPTLISLSNQTALDNAVNNLTSAIQKTTESQVALSKPLPTNRRWWSPDLTEERKRKNRLSRNHFKWRALPDHPSHAEYRKAADEFVQKVKIRQESHFTEWLANITGGTDLWNANKFITSPATDRSKQRMPSLKNPNGSSASTNEEKSQSLANTFFPPPPTNPTIPLSAPPKPVGSFKIYSQERISEAIFKSKPHKAPGPDGIPNVVLINCETILTQHLQIIYQAIFTFDIYPINWGKSTTIVLRKPGKSDYTNPNAYRPIALLNTMAKTLSTLVAADLTFLSESHELLPNTQFGGRPGRSTTDALHLLVQSIKVAWRQAQVVSVMFLDIKAAFPNVVIPILLNNMRQRRIPDKYIKFAEIMLHNRSTNLAFDDFISPDIPIINGNGQGCPLSMLFYSFYIAPLLESVKTNTTDEASLGFVDDSSLIARGNSFAETHATLKDMMERTNGCLEWSISHNSPFELGKLAIMDFTHSEAKRQLSTNLDITRTNPDNSQTTTTVKVVKTYKLLGVMLDPTLSFKPHHDLVLARAVQWTALFRRINRTTKGLSLRFARQLYIAVAVPRITYAADIWFTPPHRKNGSTRQSGMVGLTRKLDSIQRIASIAITGAMNGVAGDAAALHADIFTSKFSLLNACYKATARLATRPPEHPLYHFINRASKGPTTTHTSTLHTLLHLSNIDAHSSEKIRPFFKHPNFKPQLRTCIAPDKETALEWDRVHHNDECMVYTDGSGFEGGIGASAVMFLNGREHSSLKLYLGTEKEHTVYEGELVGIILALHLIKHLNTDPDHANISLDNQPAIQAIHHRKPQPSYYLLEEIHNATKSTIKDHALSYNLTISLTWVPGHMDATGNETADILAKEAAQGDSSAKHRLPTFLHNALPLSSAATKQELRKQVKRLQRNEWSKSTRFARLNKIDPSLPSRRFVKLSSDLTRAQTSILTQLRTNHAPLNAYLHRITKTDNPACKSCHEADETIEHFLFTCPTYLNARLKLRRKLKNSSENPEILMNDKYGIKQLIQYIQDTNRFTRLSPSLGPTPIPLIPPS